MIFVEIDDANDKHDCFIISSEGDVLADVFTVGNSREGYEALLHTINTCIGIDGKIKVRLEATGHYSYNLLGFLLDNGLPTYVINPLYTNLYRKSLSLLKTKTDRDAARVIIFVMLFTSQPSMSAIGIRSFPNILLLSILPMLLFAKPFLHRHQFTAFS